MISYHVKVYREIMMRELDPMRPDELRQLDLPNGPVVVVVRRSHEVILERSGPLHQNIESYTAGRPGTES